MRDKDIRTDCKHLMSVVFDGYTLIASLLATVLYVLYRRTKSSYKQVQTVCCNSSWHTSCCRRQEAKEMSSGLPQCRVSWIGCRI